MTREWVDARSFCFGLNNDGPEEDKIFKHIETLITPMIEAMDFELVQVRMIGGGRKTLQIMVEPSDHERSMTLDDCAELSHAISALLDVEDPIPGAYSLEISSPGIDRPLTRPKDFQRFVGHEAKIDLFAAVEGRKTLRGVLQAPEDEKVCMIVDGERVAVEFGEIKKAKLVLTDALIKSKGRAA